MRNLWVVVLITTLIAIAAGCGETGSGPQLPVNIKAKDGDYQVNLSLPNQRLGRVTSILVYLPEEFKDVVVSIPSEIDGREFYNPTAGVARGSYFEPIDLDPEGVNWLIRFHLKTPPPGGEVWAGNAVIGWGRKTIYLGLWYGPKEKFAAAAKSVGYSYEEFLVAK